MAIPILRADLQRQADHRVLEARALLDLGYWGWSYYTAGYAVEFALKACIARKTREHEFPDLPRAQRAYLHELPKLLVESGLKPLMDAEESRKSLLYQNWWHVVGPTGWTEHRRYRESTAVEARDLLEAITNVDHGVLPWIKKHW